MSTVDMPVYPFQPTSISLVMFPKLPASEERLICLIPEIKTSPEPRYVSNYWREKNKQNGFHALMMLPGEGHTLQS